MTKQDQRVRNRRVKKQAIIVRKRILGSINNRILKPLYRELKKESNLNQASVLAILNAVFMHADLVARVNDLRTHRNLSDIKAYSHNFLREVNIIYGKEKKRQAKPS